MNERLCIRESHDCFGKPYKDCLQCYVRDNPGQENPWLMTPKEFTEWIEKQKAIIAQTDAGKDEE
jgi:hypothetical protein